MVGFYDEMQGIASDLLREFKQGTIEYVAVTPGNGPPDNPGPSQEVAYTLDATARGVRFQFIDGTSIVSSDLQLTMAVRDDVTPDMKGFVRMDGVRYKIVGVRPIPPAGVTVANVIIFRK